MKKISILALLGVFVFGMWIPAETAVSAQNRQWRSQRVYRTSAWRNRQIRRRNGSWYGYRNYGQYRRTQVGNRRFRWHRQYYWRDGIRRSRMIRIYY